MVAKQITGKHQVQILSKSKYFQKKLVQVSLYLFQLEKNIISYCFYFSVSNRTIEAPLKLPGMKSST